MVHASLRLAPSEKYDMNQTKRTKNTEENGAWGWGLYSFACGGGLSDVGAIRRN